MKKIFCIFLVLSISFPVLSQEKSNKFTPQDYLAMSSLSSPRMSPDGALIVYVLGEKKKWDSLKNNNLWLISADGTKRLQLTNSEKSDNHPRSKWVKGFLDRIEERLKKKQGLTSSQITSYTEGPLSKLCKSYFFLSHENIHHLDLF